MEEVLILDDDHEIIDVLKAKANSDIFKWLDKTPAGIICLHIIINNKLHPAILLKFAKSGDSGLGLVISNTNSLKPILFHIEHYLKIFNIKMSLEEFISKYTIEHL